MAVCVSVLKHTHRVHYRLVRLSRGGHKRVREHAYQSVYVRAHTLRLLPLFHREKVAV